MYAVNIITNWILLDYPHKTRNKKYFVEHINQTIFVMQTRFSILFYNQMVIRNMIQNQNINIPHSIIQLYTSYIRILSNSHELRRLLL